MSHDTSAPASRWVIVDVRVRRQYVPVVYRTSALAEKARQELLRGYPLDHAWRQILAVHETGKTGPRSNDWDTVRHADAIIAAHAAIELAGGDPSPLEIARRTHLGFATVERVCAMLRSAGVVLRMGKRGRVLGHGSPGQSQDRVTSGADSAAPLPTGDSCDDCTAQWTHDEVSRLATAAQQDWVASATATTVDGEG